MAHRLRAVICFWILLIELGSSTVYAQGDVLSGKPTFNLHQLDNRYGLSNSAVNCILQGSDGMLWVGTWDGLNRYDGQTFHVFNLRSGTSGQGLISNVIQGLTEDRQQRIWISTVEGISRYDKKFNVFRHYFYGSNGKQGVGDNGFGVVCDSEGRIFARTPMHGLVRYIAAQDTFVQVNLPTVEQSLVDIRMDDSNRLWVRTAAGSVVGFNSDNLGIRPRYVIRKKATDLHVANGKAFASDASGNLYRLVLDNVDQSPIVRIGGRIGTLTYYAGNYYIGKADRGLLVYDGTFSPLPLPKGMQSLEGMKIRGWAEGVDQLLWVATDGNGFIRASQHDTPFHTISPYTATSRQPVRAITEIDGDLWIGTKGEGVRIIPDFVPQQGGRANWKRDLNMQLSNLDVFTIVPSKQHSLVYIGTDGSGLSIADRTSGRVYDWQHVEGSAEFPDFRSVYAILEDPDGSLWVGTSGYGLLHLRVTKAIGGVPRVQFIKQYRYIDPNRGLANDIVYSLSFGKANQLWIACRYGGLSLLNKVTGHVKNFKAFTYEGSLSHNDVLSLYHDAYDRLWVGTSYGLNWTSLADLHPERPIFRRMTAADGLPNNTIHAITDDANGAIWVSTNKGLACIEPATGGAVRFQETDGLQHAEFSDGAVWKDALGYLYFGGINGVSYFHPQHIPQEAVVPPLVIEQVQLGGHVYGEGFYAILQSHAPWTQQVVLARDENYFSATVQALSFLFADRCEYAWMLEGHDKTWLYHRSDGQITYANIPPGAYRLLIKWSNGSGQWTEPVPMLDLRVKTYWWQTWPAITTALAILLYFVYWWYRNRKNKLKIQHGLQLERSLREKDESLHAKQLDFFTNIAHELQTPLTVVMGVAEQLESTQTTVTPTQTAKSRSLMSLLKQQASRLSYLVQQLLEFRKVQAGHLAPHYQYQDVSSLLTRIGEVFLPMSVQQQNVYEVNIPDGLLFTVDSDKIEKIAFNLLSNAFKHGGRHEHVIFTVQVLENPHVLRLQVGNSGCRLAPTESKRIFEKFHTGPSGESGVYSTGIGLAFCRELATVLDGEIRATIEEGWITFDVRLPIPNDLHLKPLPEAEPTDTPDYVEMAKPVADALHTVDYNKVALLEKLTETNKKSILVVEDEPDIRYLIREVLRRHYIIYEADDGLEAINLIKQHPPDLIISDVMMPGMDGLTLCEKVKNTPATCHIPVVILSAKGTVAQRNEGYELGADAYIAKPFQGSHLFVRVKNLLDQRDRLHNQLRRANSIEEVIHHSASEHSGFLETLVTHIKKRLDDPELNAAVLEEVLSLSKMQLYRKLKSVSGMTPAEFIRHIRLKHATQLLANTELTINEIFYQTGFNNQSYFFREFKKHYGCSPNEYRSRLNLNT